jgi:Ni/Co efflux regulator RcnB
MKKSLYASAAVLALVLASPALAQNDNRDNKDENAPRSGHVSHDNDNQPRENRERPAPSPTVSPNGTTGGERGTRERPAPSGTMGTEGGTHHERGTRTEPSGTMGTEGGTRHERGTNNTMRPSNNAMRPSRRGETRTNTSGAAVTTPRGTRAIGTGPHVHNPAFNSMRRAFNAPQRFHASVYVRPSGWYSHRWTFGEFLPVFFFTRNYWILDFGNFGLDDPPPGTIWVRVGDDALLIDEYSGEVIEVVYGVFY